MIRFLRWTNVKCRDRDVGRDFKNRMNDDVGADRAKNGAIRNEMHDLDAGDPRPRHAVNARWRCAIDRRLEQRDIAGRALDQSIRRRGERDLVTTS